MNTTYQFIFEWNDIVYNIEVRKDNKIYFLGAYGGETISQILRENEIFLDQPCGGNGTCGKCKVKVNNREELACQYIINGDCTVILPSEERLAEKKTDAEAVSGNCFFALDIGTTTLVLALVSRPDGKLIDVISSLNPQRQYGADIMGRIGYCTEHGVERLNKCLIDEINKMAEKILGKHSAEIDTMYVSANTTMMHTLYNTDCSGIGYAPYTPKFLDGRTVAAKEIGIDFCNSVVSLNCLHSFIGADISAGLEYIGFPAPGKYNILLDLGTNAEIAFMSRDRIISTSAAAGPCFEGENISCGMSAVDGAICSLEGDDSYTVIGGGEPRGFCATGLIDTIGYLLSAGIADETGYMGDGTYPITKDVYITTEDMRNFQLAKSAVYSAVVTLMKKYNISYDDIDNFYVAGGFSDKMNPASALRVGLFPKELYDKFRAINNSSLLGTIKYAVRGRSIISHCETEYIDLSADSGFADTFIDNMCFEL